MGRAGRFGLTVVAIAAIVVLGGLGVALRSPTPDPTPPSVPTVPDVPAVDPLPWQSVTWRKVDGAFELGAVAGQDRIDGVVVSPRGLLGRGRVATPGRNEFNGMGAVFLSVDGERWQTVRIEAGVGLADTSELYEAVDGPAGIVVLGNVCCSEEEGPALWRSPDGVGWERLPVPPELAAGSVADLVAVPAGYVVAGQIAGRAAVWTSPDGVAWTAVDPDEAGLGPGQITSLSVTSLGVLAAGYRDGETYDGSIWESGDGLDWSARPAAPVLGGPLDTALWRIVEFSGGWWMHGNEGPHEDRVRCEQFGAMASTGGPLPLREAAFVCGWGNETHWASRDGRTWERLPEPFARAAADVPRGQLIEFRLVEPGGPGLVALGEGFEDGHPSVWVSADGRSWRRLREVGGLRPGQSATGFVASGRRLVAVGENWDPNGNAPGRPAVWIGEVR